MDNCDISNNKHVRMVVSLTTVPGREDLIVDTCRSIANQTIKPDAIYLTIPKVPRRFDKKYGEFPDEIKSICTIIEPETDYGPITKIYGGLMMESDPDTIVVSCDDDIIYPPKTLEILLEKSKIYSDSAICGSGMFVGRGIWLSARYSNLDKYLFLSGFTPPKSGRKVDLIYGSSGVLYKRSFFPPIDKCIDELFSVALGDLDILCNDDLLVSAYLAKKNIPRLTFPDLPIVTMIENKGQHPEVALSYARIECLNRMDRAINKLKEMGYFETFEPYALDETVTVNWIFAGIMIILAIGLLVLMFMTINKPVDIYSFS